MNANAKAERAKRALAEELEHAITAELRRRERNVIPSACPACGGRWLAPIAYGAPTGDELREARRGAVVLGGKFRVGLPTVECRTCKTTSGRTIAREEAEPQVA